MNKETRHLLFWWREWAARLLRTTYHLFNRRAYHKWKNKRRNFNYQAQSELFPELDAMEENDYF